MYNSPVEAPPGYTPPRKSKTGLIIGIIALSVIVCCCGVCGLGGYFGKGVLKAGSGMVSCGVSIEMQRDALLAYAEAHGGKLPAAANWQDAIKAYAKTKPATDKNPFEVPGPEADYCDASGPTSLFLNKDIAGKSLDSIKDQMGTVALFEHTGRGRNQSAKWEEQPIGTSPEMIFGERRGWLRQGVTGGASILDKRGRLVPFNAKASGTTVTINTNGSND